MREAMTEKLARALIHAQAPQVMIERARAGYYDDYKSPLSLPIQALVQHARLYHLNGIALRAMNGEFDAQEWEADEWAKSDEGQAAFLSILQDGGKHDR